MQQRYLKLCNLHGFLGTFFWVWLSLNRDWKDRIVAVLPVCVTQQWLTEAGSKTMTVSSKITVHLAVFRLWIINLGSCNFFYIIPGSSESSYPTFLLLWQPFALEFFFLILFFPFCWQPIPLYPFSFCHSQYTTS